MTVKKLRLMYLLIFFTMTISCSKYIVQGKYRTNFATYGMFGKTLTINCDSSAVMNFAGDLMNDNSYGRWKTIMDTLIITFDTINHPDSRFKNEMNFRINGRKLYNIPFTKSKYIEILKSIENSENDNIKIPSYRKFNRQLEKNMTNHKGTMRRQYFVRFEQLNCN